MSTKAPFRQVITITPSGGLFGLQHKKGQGIDLRKFGQAKIDRVTLIEWSEENQRWQIIWNVSGPRWSKGDIWCRATFAHVGLHFEEVHAEGWGDRTEDGVKLPAPYAFFTEYDDAVAAEVRVIQELQLRGEYTSQAA